MAREIDPDSPLGRLLTHIANGTDPGEPVFFLPLGELVPPPYTRADLDAKKCGNPGCDHSAHDKPLYVHAPCHLDAPPWFAYYDGVLVVTCSVCDAFVCGIRVAS
jgi:hypothetical protein